MPVTVWLLDPPTSATVVVLRARLRLALADPAAPTPARSIATGHATRPAAIRSAATDAAQRATGTPGVPTEPGATAVPDHSDRGSRRGLDDRAPADEDRASHGLRRGTDTDQRPARCAPLHPPVGEHDTAAPHTRCIGETLTDPVTDTPEMTGDPTGAHGTIAGSVAGFVPGSVRGAASHIAPETARPAARCVFLDAGRDPLDASALAVAAAGLGPRDVLAVMTVSHHDGERLHDPRPALVAAAIEAGLQHRQHIVTITRHHDTGPGQQERGKQPGGERGWELGPDLSLFTRTPTRHGRDQAHGIPSATSATSDEPDVDNTADPQQEAHR